MKNASNLQKVSLIFFFILGFLQILGGIWSNQGQFLPTSLIVHRILDIPFAMTGLVYGCSTIHNQAREDHQKILGILFTILIVAIFLLLLGINIFFPDKTLSV